MRIRRAGLLTLALVCAAEPLVAKEPSRVRLAWVREPGAESCPSEREVARRVSARLGRDPFDDDAPRLIEGSARKSGETWRAEVRVRDESGRLVGEREPLESRGVDCVALGDAIVLAVALAIDPEAALAPPSSASPTPPLPPPPPPLPAEAPEPAPAAPCPAPAPCPHCPACPPSGEPAVPSVSFSGRALAAVGILPNAAAGAGVAGDLEVAERWHAALGIAWFPEVDTDDGSFAFGLSAVTLAGCFDAVELADAELATCAGIAVGAIHAVVRTLEPVQPGDYLWMAATASPRLRVRPAGALLLEIGGELAIPLIANDFVVRGRPGSAFEAPAVGAIGFVGIGAILP